MSVRSENLTQKKRPASRKRKYEEMMEERAKLIEQNRRIQDHIELHLTKFKEAKSINEKIKNLKIVFYLLDEWAFWMHDKYIQLLLLKLNETGKFKPKLKSMTPDEWEKRKLIWGKLIKFVECLEPYSRMYQDKRRKIEIKYPIARIFELDKEWLSNE